MIELTVDASDPDGDNLSYEYRTDWGTVEADGPRAKWNLRRAPEGTYTVTVKVNDGRGGVKVKSASVTVEPMLCCLPPCITLSIDCPEDVEEGQVITFTANITGGEPEVTPTFNWTLSAGTIVKGDGTYRIEVDTTGLEGQVIKATLEVGGYPPECSTRASCETRVNKKMQ